MKQKTDILVLYEALKQAVMPLADPIMQQYANVMNSDDFENEPKNMNLSDILDFASCVCYEVEWQKDHATR